MRDETNTEVEVVRILGRQIGRELTHAEMGLVSGGEIGESLDEQVSTDTDSHPGTCTHESDCD